jgi:hypothetical protein
VGRGHAGTALSTPRDPRPIPCGRPAALEQKLTHSRHAHSPEEHDLAPAGRLVAAYAHNIARITEATWERRAGIRRLINASA